MTPNISQKTYENIMSELRLKEIKLQKEIKEIADVNTNVELYYPRLNALLPKIGYLKPLSMQWT